MKSKILDSWVGQRVVVVRNRDDDEDGILLEHGSCWVTLRLTDSGEEQFVRVAGHDRIRLAHPAELTPWGKWQAEIQERKDRDRRHYEQSDEQKKEKQLAEWRWQAQAGFPMEDWEREVLAEADK
jgi:hypothetical protein